MTEGEKQWFMGGGRMPPKLALALAVTSALIAVGQFLLSLSSEAGWARWVQWATGAVFVFNAVYYTALFVHRWRRG